MTLDAAHWQDRLSELVRVHAVVGATLAIGQGDHTVTAAAGALNMRTGQPATADSLFQMGSITKVWTTTLVMQLVDEGLVDLDAPMVRYLPGFRVADDDLTRSVTTRQLLSHTSGIDGDLFADTGRGDDAVASYVGAMADLTRTVPPGRLMSYCNSGFVLAGHLVATLRGQPWETVLRERLLSPLGLATAGTLPEEALLHGAAAGHMFLPGTDGPVTTHQWAFPRALGPAGLLHSTARDQLVFARMHERGGVTADGTRLLSAGSAAAMRVPHIEVPNHYPYGTHWALGWALSDWNGQAVYGHDGGTLGQAAYLRILPAADLFVCLGTNGARASQDLYRELLGEICAALVGDGVAPPARPMPVDDCAIDPSRYVGTYRRHGVEYVITEAGGALTATLTTSQPHDRDEAAPVVGPLLAHDERVLLFHPDGLDTWELVTFLDVDGTRYLHHGARGTPRVVP